MELSEKKSKAQFHLLLKATRSVLSGLFGSGLPADRVLAAFYRENRQCGSRDRALINNSIYTLLRHWGWVRQLSGKELASAIENNNAALSNRDLGAMIFFALAASGSHPSRTRQAADFLELDLPQLPSASRPVQRAREAALLLGIDMCFDTRDLLPKWAEKRLYLPYGESILNRPPMWLRLNTSHREETLAELRQAGIEYTSINEFPEALAISDQTVNLMLLDSFKKGAFEVQDLASQAIAAFCAPQKGERWFDPCAGAGGKTLALAEAMGRTGTVTAGDIREKVLIELRKRARRAGYPNIQIHAHNGKPWRNLKPFDGVLIDAPCSCSGVWRRNPGNPWILTPKMVTEHAALQLEILKNFAGCVKVGGKVIYATCSAFAEENEEVIQAFLAADDRFESVPAIDPFTGKTGSGFMRVPENYNCDRMFAAALERKK